MNLRNNCLYAIAGIVLTLFLILTSGSVVKSQTTEIPFADGSGWYALDLYNQFRWEARDKFSLTQFGLVDEMDIVSAGGAGGTLADNIPSVYVIIYANQGKEYRFFAMSKSAARGLREGLVHMDLGSDSK